ncbi:hypothetical protein [Streptomyces violascens]|uniref:hypothetical protein n=1 Tax=Streptomyces violascens TaxID=67381 RepID=UPI001CFC97A8|nr:hypothetical protein [Streptomyces violascens]
MDAGGPTREVGDPAIGGFEEDVPPAVLLPVDAGSVPRGKIDGLDVPRQVDARILRSGTDGQDAVTSGVGGRGYQHGRQDEWGREQHFPLHGLTTKNFR